LIFQCFLFLLLKQGKFLRLENQWVVNLTPCDRLPSEHAAVNGTGCEVAARYASAHASARSVLGEVLWNRGIIRYSDAALLSTSQTALYLCVLKFY